MSVYLRQARKADLEDIFNLAKQFVLLNLPANKKKLAELIELSEGSFSGKVKKHEAEYIFVAEDTEIQSIVAASKIVAKHGTQKNPHIFYKVSKKEKFSTDLGIGFIHQVLKFKENVDGPTELGGLIVDKEYRRRPEKVGKTISLVRFMYIAAHIDMFEKELHSEMVPPLTEEGRSEFWEALGRRFTGLPYEEADRLSQVNKEFIKSLFPEDDIYLTLLSSKARLVIGSVGEQTRPARMLLERLGFKYKNEVDPFDGGPHLGVKTKDAKPVQKFKEFKFKVGSKISAEKKRYLIGGHKEGEFRAKLCAPEIKDNELILSKEINKELEFENNQKVFSIPIDY